MKTHPSNKDKQGGKQHGHAGGVVDMGNPAVKERHGKNPPQASHHHTTTQHPSSIDHHSIPHPMTGGLPGGSDSKS